LHWEQVLAKTPQGDQLRKHFFDEVDKRWKKLGNSWTKFLRHDDVTCSASSDLFWPAKGHGAGGHLGGLALLLVMSDLMDQLDKYDDEQLFVRINYGKVTNGTTVRDITNSGSAFDDFFGSYTGNDAAVVKKALEGKIGVMRAWAAKHGYALKLTAHLFTPSGHWTSGQGAEYRDGILAGLGKLGGDIAVTTTPVRMLGFVLDTALTFEAQAARGRDGEAGQHPAPGAPPLPGPGAHRDAGEDARARADSLRRRADGHGGSRPRRAVRPRRHRHRRAQL
jgi:hypothetical protein